MGYTWLSLCLDAKCFEHIFLGDWIEVRQVFADKVCTTDVCLVRLSAVDQSRKLWDRSATLHVHGSVLYKQSTCHSRNGARSLVENTQKVQKRQIKSHINMMDLFERTPGCQFIDLGVNICILLKLKKLLISMFVLKTSGYRTRPLSSKGIRRSIFVKWLTTTNLTWQLLSSVRTVTSKACLIVPSETFFFFHKTIKIYHNTVRNFTQYLLKI